jgi:hypothetical protein
VIVDGVELGYVDVLPAMSILKISLIGLDRFTRLLIGFGRNCVRSRKPKNQTRDLKLKILEMKLNLLHEKSEIQNPQNESEVPNMPGLWGVKS